MHVHPSGTIDYLVLPVKRSEQKMYAACGLVKGDDSLYPDVRYSARCEITVLRHGGAFKVSAVAATEDEAIRMIWALSGHGDFAPMKEDDLRNLFEEQLKNYAQ